MKSIEEYKLHYALTDEVIPENEAEQVIYSLIDEFANDKNSSKFREDITKIMVGLRPSEGKLGYDDDNEPIEVKPVNFSSKSKLDGRGNFSDFTWARHNKYLKDNVKMLVSGFHKGKLLFIIQFPYTNIKDRVEYILKQKLPNGDVKGVYVRNLTFNYIHWKDTPYEIKYNSSKIKDLKRIFNKKFYKLLTDIPNDTQLSEQEEQFTEFVGPAV